MAYSSNDALQTIAKEATEALQAFTPTWQKFANIFTDEVAVMRRWADHGVGSLKTWDGSSEITTAAYQSSREQTISPSGYASKVVLTDFDVKTMPNLVEKKTFQLLQGVEQRIEQLVYSTLEAGFTTSVDVGGSTDPIISAFSSYIDTTGNGTYDTAQSNLLTAALSPSALNSAREKLANQKTPDNEPAGMGRGSMSLLVNPKNGALAKQLTGSAELGNVTLSADGTGNLNPNFNSGISYIASPWIDADDDDWFLVEDQTSVSVWLPYAPRVFANQTNAGSYELCATVWMAAWIDTPPLGVIGSNVAG